MSNVKYEIYLRIFDFIMGFIYKIWNIETMKTSN